MRSSRWFFAGIFAVCGMVAGEAQASLIYYLSQTNTVNVPPVTPPYASITLDSVAVGSVQGVQFTIDSLSPNYIVDQFYFNTDLAGGKLRLASSSVSPAPSLNTTAGNIAADGFGKFGFEFNTNQPSNFALTSYTFTIVAQNGGVDVSSLLSDWVAHSANPNGGNTFGSSGISGEGCPDFQEEVGVVPEAVGHSFDDFDLVVDALQEAGV